MAGTEQAPSPRLGNSLTLVNDSLYLFGGMDQNKIYDELHLFNLKTNKWTTVETRGTRPPPRCAHSAIVMDNKLFVYGGMTDGPKVLDDLYVLDTGEGINIESLTWTCLETQGFQPSERLDQDMTVIEQDHEASLLLFGGMNLKNTFNDVYVLNRI